MNPSNSGLQEWEKDFTPRVIEAIDLEPQRENFTRLYFTNKYPKRCQEDNGKGLQVLCEV